ncbi:hypothetical protein GLOIN_2v1781358 [Rhizophagus irregularis DAOM 181602=DAOM 197198]|nr:hypothetical protein GLOIN_2v1781358 [Rhizophagus irregularis DAOM 181602=DAOM 197198]
MRNLDLNDDAMDIDTVSFGEKSSPNKTAVSSSSVPLKGKATPVKIPVKVTGSKYIPAKAVTKNDLLSLLRSADFRKLLREILQEELLSARKVTEIPEDLVEEEQEEDIRCLADTCANASFIQREAAEELGLDIDKNPIQHIWCFRNREVGLSRTCLKRYNYDVHESREHIAFTCDGKNVFIPIVPDANRGDKK